MINDNNLEDYLTVIEQQQDTVVKNFLLDLMTTKFGNKQLAVVQQPTVEYMGVSDLAVKCGYYVSPHLRAKLGIYVSKQYSKKDQVKEEQRRMKKQNLIVTVKLYPANDPEVIELIEIFCDALL